jgi:hypothetical protein
MPTMKKRKKSGKTPPFVAITWELLNSKTYKELPFSARTALVYFSGKTKRFPTELDYYEIEFEFPYAEAENLGFSRGTFFQIINSLVRYGFIDPVIRGGKRGFGYSNSVFKVSKRWSAYGTYLFVKKEWTEMELQKTVSRAKTECHKFKNCLEKTGRSSVIGLVGGKSDV